MARAMSCRGEAGVVDYRHRSFQDSSCAAYSLRYTHMYDPFFVVQAVSHVSEVCFPIRDHG